MSWKSEPVYFRDMSGALQLAGYSTPVSQSVADETRKPDTYVYTDLTDNLYYGPSVAWRRDDCDRLCIQIEPVDKEGWLAAYKLMQEKLLIVQEL